MHRIAFMLLTVLSIAAVTLPAATPESLDQGWTADDRQWFYTTPQGSKLIPYRWAIALELASSQDLFFADGLRRLGYLPNAKSPRNRDGLPVGFVRDEGREGDHLGMTCAACHTSEINYQGTVYRVNGAPASSDLFGLLAELSESLSATSASANDLKFRRFAGRVLGSGHTRAQRAKLYTQLVAFAKNFSAFVTDSTPRTQWGYARADAFAAIFNRVTAIDLGVPENNRQPNAPVSYPFLWGTSWHNIVQWNGSAPNQVAILRLARNVGEVLGVFGQIEIQKPKPSHWYYESTAKLLNLLEIEDRLAQLRSPRWPARFPAINSAKAALGQAIYNAQCLSCHAIATPGKEQSITMTPIAQLGTDSTMVMDAATRQAKTGVLEGVRMLLFAGEPFGPTARAGSITFNAVIGAIVSPVPKREQGASQSQTKSSMTSSRQGKGSESELREHLLSKEHQRSPRLIRAQDSSTPSSPVALDLLHSLEAIAEAEKAAPPAVPAYKARPLDGIWATAPYLHNGSVPTLNDLLADPASRPKTFYVGSREFDPVAVGFDVAPGPGRFLFDTSKPANSNGGHVWGTARTAEDRDALLEYLKSL